MGFPTLQLILCEFSVILRPSEISCFSLTWPTIGPAIPVLKGCCVHLVELPIPAAGTKTCFFPHLSGEGCQILCQPASSSFFSSSAGPELPQLQARDRSGPHQGGPCRPSTASSWSQWSLPDPNSKPRIRVVHAGPQLQARDRSGPCRTSITSARSQCSPPDPNSNRWMKVTLAEPRPQRISEDNSDRMPERMSGDMPDTYAR